MKVHRKDKSSRWHKVDVPQIGKCYHLIWAKNGCVWQLIEINGDRVKMKTPKTNKVIESNLSDLRHTRRNQGK